MFGWLAGWLVDCLFISLLVSQPIGWLAGQPHRFHSSYQMPDFSMLQKCLLLAF